MENIFTRAARFLREQRLNRRWRNIVGVLAGLVVFCTTYALILPAMTAERQTICGMEAHEHTEECFENGVQICGKQEHVHTEECYAQGKGITVGVIVGPQGNSVTDVPSEPADGELEVDLTGGNASEQEGQQPEEEPVPGKTEGELAQELSAVTLTGNWGKDAAATAKAHQGCRESGMEMIRQVLSYNQITGIPDASGSYADWVADIRGAGCYKDVSSIPKTGDLVFIDREDNGEPLGREDERIDHAGIVIHVETEKRTIEATGEKVKTLQSIMLLTDNADGLIESYFYSMQDPANVNTIVGYARLPKNPAAAAEEETESQAETQGETAEPADTQNADTAADTASGDGMEENAGPTETQNADTASGNGTEMTGTEAEAGTDQTEPSGTVTEGQTEEETAEPGEDEQKPEGTTAEGQPGEETTETDIKGYTEDKITEQTAEGQGPADTAANGQTQEAEDKTEPSEMTTPADETKTDAGTPGTETDMEMSTEADTDMSANEDMETEPETDMEEPETDLIAETPEMKTEADTEMSTDTDIDMSSNEDMETEMETGTGEPETEFITETPEMETEADTEMSTDTDIDMSSNEDMETEMETGIEEPGTETVTETAGTNTETSAYADTDMSSIEDKEDETDIGDWGWTQEDLENEASTEEWIDDRGWLWTDFAVKDDTGENETESWNPAGKDFENETESWNPIREDFENETETEWDEWDHLEAETETEAAGSDPEADLETSEDWEASVADTELTGVWADDLTMIAETQLGVKESTENFTFNENGEQKGITRYGQWYGEPYGDWDAMFVSFCLNYAEVPHSSVPRAGNCGTLAGMLQTYGLYEEPAEYEASKGDLVFLDTDADGAADHVGILEEATESGVGGINVIAGDVEDEVKTVVYAKDDAALVGYGRLPQKPAQKMEKKEYNDGKVRVVVEYPAEAMIPEDAYLIADEIPQDDERYKEQMEIVQNLIDSEKEQTEETEPEEGISTVSLEDENAVSEKETELETEQELYMRVYNIGFYVDEQEVEPQAEVKVSIEVLDDPYFAAGAKQVVHVPRQGEPENLDITNTDGEVEFSTKSFSSYTLASTDKLLGADLNSCVESAELKRKSDGKKAEEKILVSEHYTYTVQFRKEKESEIFKNGMTFKMPEGVKYDPAEGTFNDGSGNEAGTYNIADDGTVTFTFSEGYSLEGLEMFSAEIDLTVEEEGTVTFPGIEAFTADILDLEPFIEDARLTDQKGHEIPDDGQVVVGEHYNYWVEFTEAKGGEKFQRYMEFQLPDGVTSNQVDEITELYDKTWSGTEPAGKYYVDENGVVHVELYENYMNADRTDKKLDLEFDLTVEEKNDGGVTKFPWTGGVEKKFHTVIDSQAEFRKEAGEYNLSDPKGPSIEYTVEANVTSGVVYDPIISDQMNPGLSYRAGSAVIKVYDDEGHEIVFTEGEEPKLVSVVGEDGTITGWKTEGLPDLIKDQKVVITYTCDVDFDKADAADVKISGGSRSFTAKNKATFHADTPGSQPPIDISDGTEKKIEDKVLRKSGSKDMEKANSLDWEIELGSGSDDVRGYTVEDTLSNNQTIDKNRPLELKWKDEFGNNIKIYYISWDEAVEKGLIQYTDAGFKFTVPGAGSGYTFPTQKESDGTLSNPEKVWEITDEDENVTRGWTQGDRLKIEYYTTYNEIPDKGSEKFSNSATTIVDGNTFKADQDITIGTSCINKYHLEETADGEYLNYQIVVDIPKWDEFKDLLEESSAKEGEIRFRLQDKLQFKNSVKYEGADGDIISDTFYVENFPEGIEIVATPKNGGGSIKFEEITAIVDESGNITGYTSASPGSQFFYVARIGRDYDDDDLDIKGRREFQIWFNTNPPKKDKSYWTLSEAYTLTVTYKIPTSAKLIKGSKPYEVTNMTLRDILDQGYTLSNEAECKGDKDITTTDEYTGNRTQNDVKKTYEIKKMEDGSEVIEYKVAFNAFDPNQIDEHNNFGGVLIDPAQFYLVDEFDSRLEYVKGSLHVDVISPSTHRLRYRFGYDETEENNPEITVNGETTTMKAVAGKFNSRTGGDADKDSLTAYMTHSSDGTAKEQDAVYVFVYQLKLKGENMKSEGLELDNTAEVYYGSDQPSSDDATVTFTPTVLKKDGAVRKKEDGTPENIVDYTIHVNPGAADMVVVDTENGRVNLDHYTLTDQMDPNLTLQRGSIKVYEVRKNPATGETEEVPLTEISDMAQVTPDNSFYVFQEEESGNKFTLILPDQKHLKITYSADIKGTTGFEGTANNTVTLDAGFSVQDSSKADYKIQRSNGNLSSEESVHLYKKDSLTGNYIDDAKFKVYTVSSDESSDKENLEVVIGESGETKRFELYEEVSPKAIGGADISPKGSYTDYYLLLEKEAPENYKLNPEPVLFKFKEKEEGDPDTVQVTYNEQSYTAKVYYIHTGNLTIIFKDEPDTYELPETGGFGSTTYTLAGLLLMLGGAFCLMYRRNRIQKGEW